MARTVVVESLWSGHTNSIKPHTRLPSLFQYPIFDKAISISTSWLRIAATIYVYDEDSGSERPGILQSKIQLRVAEGKLKVWK